MQILPKTVLKLINEFQKLPGVGSKSAARMAYHYLKVTKEDLANIAEVFNDLGDKVFRCSVCCNYSDEKICNICTDDRRQKREILVVEEPLDAVAFEEATVFKGTYHVLGGVISPVNGVGAADLNIKDLMARVSELLEILDSQIEIILATSPTMEGEATGSYIKNQMEKFGESVLISTLARGLPSGASIEYTDKSTLSNAFLDRNKF